MYTILNLQVSRPGPSSSNTVQQNNTLNKGESEDKTNFAEEEDDEDEDEDDNDGGLLMGILVDFILN